MRTVLRLLGTRYGIAVVLIVVVLAVVGGSRALLGAHRPTPLGPVVTGPSTALSDAGGDPGDDGAVSGSDDGADNGPGPSLSPDTPAVGITASRFMTAYLKHTGVSGDQWRAGLAPNATTRLMGQLAQTDPADVPAESVTGPIDTLSEGGAVYSAAVPVNGGTITLSLVTVDGRWKVDGIDWTPS